MQVEKLRKDNAGRFFRQEKLGLFPFVVLSCCFSSKHFVVSENNRTFANAIRKECNVLSKTNEAIQHMNQIITNSYDKIAALIDFLVHFNTADISDYVTNFFSLKHSLESELGRPVDLVEDKSIRNPIFRNNVDRTKVPIYG